MHGATAKDNVSQVPRCCVQALPFRLVSGIRRQKQRLEQVERKKKKSQPLCGVCANGKGFPLVREAFVEERDI